MPVLSSHLCLAGHNNRLVLLAPAVPNGLDDRTLRVVPDDAMGSRLVGTHTPCRAGHDSPNLADSDDCLGLIGLGHGDEVLLTLQPDFFQLFDPGRMLIGQIACFRAVGAQVEEFPG